LRQLSPLPWPTFQDRHESFLQLSTQRRPASGVGRDASRQLRLFHLEKILKTKSKHEVWPSENNYLIIITQFNIAIHKSKRKHFNFKLFIIYI
jgi:hypothetical protein